MFLNYLIQFSTKLYTKIDLEMCIFKNLEIFFIKEWQPWTVLADDLNFMKYIHTIFNIIIFKILVVYVYVDFRQY